MDRMKLNIELYKKIYLIRRSEEKIKKHFYEDEMKTPVHLSVGEEAIAAGVISALDKKDQFLGTYRSHGIYLARTGETDKFFAELHGKETGVVKGKAGSMHLCAPEMGFLGASAIVGSIIPVGVGAAFANKYLNNKKIVSVFFGDGAVDEGVFWESLNLACLMKLPILFVCEDNELAVFTKATDRQGYKSFTDIVSKFDCSVFEGNTTDVEEIYNITNKAIKAIKQKDKPTFLHLKYYRYLEHVGVNEDFDAGYRSKKEFEKWFEKDPIKIQRKKLLKLECSEEEIKDIEKKIDEQINSSYVKAQMDPFPKEDELCYEVFA